MLSIALDFFLSLYFAIYCDVELSFCLVGEIATIYTESYNIANMVICKGTRSNVNSSQFTYQEIVIQMQVQAGK